MQDSSQRKFVILSLWTFFPVIHSSFHLFHSFHFSHPFPQTVLTLTKKEIFKLGDARKLITSVNV